MTEAEWLRCTHQKQFVTEIKEYATERKLALWVVACCRTHKESEAPELQALLYAAELYVERSCADIWDELWLGLSISRKERYVMDQDFVSAMIARHVEHLFTDGKLTHRWDSDSKYLSCETEAFVESHKYHMAVMESNRVVCLLGRDIFGNPFRPVAFDPAWRSSTALAIATGIYDDRAFDRLPILADAIQDAGCENEDILNHLRSEGPHVKGCWALDLVLGKS